VPNGQFDMEGGIAMVTSSMPLRDASSAAYFFQNGIFFNLQ
jgi:hypothetical protein